MVMKYNLVITPLSIYQSFIQFDYLSIQRPVLDLQPATRHRPTSQETEAVPNLVYFWLFGRAMLLQPEFHSIIEKKRR